MAVLIHYFLQSVWKIYQMVGGEGFEPPTYSVKRVVSKANHPSPFGNAQKKCADQCITSQREKIKQKLLNF